MLCQTTVRPVGTVAGFGENDGMPLMSTMSIVIAPVGVGVLVRPVGYGFP